MKIEPEDPATSDVFVTLDGAVIGHLIEADEDAGYVIQQLPYQPPTRIEGVVVIHKPKEEAEG